MLFALDTSKASGPDGISGKMLKETAISIAPVLTELFNMSLTCGRILLSGNCHLLSQSRSYQVMQTIPQITCHYLFSQWSARSWKDIFTA